MTNNYQALAGTTNPSFKIGSMTMYTGTSAPSSLNVPSPNNGDLYILLGSTPSIYQYGTSGWTVNGSSITGSTLARYKIPTNTYLASNANSYLGASLGNTSIYLPAGTANKTFTIKDESGMAFSQPQTIIPHGSDTIDGNATVSINVNYGSINLIYGDDGWFIW